MNCHIVLCIHFAILKWTVGCLFAKNTFHISFGFYLYFTNLYEFCYFVWMMNDMENFFIFCCFLLGNSHVCNAHWHASSKPITLNSNKNTQRLNLFWFRFRVRSIYHSSVGEWVFWMLYGFELIGLKLLFEKHYCSS